tara:strand:+ start:114 stop:344 length:231 start_codon:yes stop_codon:yes gene_type:complete
MLSIKVRHNESSERAVSRLKNLVVKEGVLNAVKDKRYFTKPSLKRKLKREAAQRQRVKDYHKEIKAAQREWDSFLQ